MIVKCEQCQTRFKIPDDKVTDKGVKVRCTKCSHTFRVTRDMAQPATAAAPAASADPFARFGAVPSDPADAEVTRPGVFALGVEATRNPDVPGKRAAPAAVPFDFGSLSPPTGVNSAPTVPAVPAYVPPSAPASSPFDFAAIAKPAAVAPAAAPAAFDFSNFAAPTQPLAPLPQVRPNAAPAAPPLDFAQMAPPAQPSGAGAFDMGGFPPFGESGPPMDAGAAPYPGGMSDAAPPFPGGMPNASPFPGAGAAAADGFFGGGEEAPAASAADGAAARAMFDMPPQEPAPSSLLDLPAPEPEAPPARNIERVTLSRPEAPPPQVVQPPPPDEPARRRTVVGIVVNVAIAAVLVLGLVVVGSAYLNEGKFSTDALSLENLRNTFAPSVDFVANDVSNGLYETRAGRSVFFVRGDVMNRSEVPVKVVVKAEIVEDGKMVRAGESWAGEPATPEEMFLIDSSEALEALNRKVEKRSLVVPAGAAASFVVPFTEYPPDLKDFRVRVSARAVAATPTAANP
jgi:predicted Zn finger-like uncharacterized protein